MLNCLQSRKVLAQQLLISKDLTQKVKLNESSDSEGEDVAIIQSAATKSNPWVNGQKSENEIDTFLTGYRKFWEQEHEKKLTKNADNETKEHAIDYENVIEDVKPQSVQCKVQNLQVKPVKKLEKKVNGEISIPKRKPKLKEKVYSTSCIWEVTDVNDPLDKVFDVFENKLEEKLKNKYAKLKKSLKQDKVKRKKTVAKKIKNKKFDLSLPKKTIKPVIDQELRMNEDEDANENIKDLINVIRKDLNVTNENNKNVDETKKEVKIVQLNTKLPDLLITDDNEDDLVQRATIAGAFEDEDVVEEFNKEKNDDIEQNKPKDIDLTLPGWGSWGGKNVPSLKRKRKRFIIRMPKKVKRRDENKGNVIIYEGGNKDIKNHLVSDLPFPFKSVKDFEASIRQPLGNTFVPETAFRKLTLPAVKTKLGTIIEPLSEDILLKQ